MKVGDTVRDNVTLLRGRVVSVNSGGVVINRSWRPGVIDNRHYTWTEAYRYTFPGHRRLEVIK